MSKQEKLLAEKTVGLKPSGIRKFFDLVSEMKDAISLGVGEPDFDTPWHIRDEGIYSLEKGRTFYTSNAGLMDLRKEICTYLKRKYNVSICLCKIRRSFPRLIYFKRLLTFSVPAICAKIFCRKTDSLHNTLK